MPGLKTEDHPIGPIADAFSEYAQRKFPEKEWPRAAQTIYRGLIDYEPDLTPFDSVEELLAQAVRTFGRKRKWPKGVVPLLRRWLKTLPSPPLQRRDVCILAARAATVWDLRSQPPTEPCDLIERAYIQTGETLPALWGIVPQIGEVFGPDPMSAYATYFVTAQMFIFDEGTRSALLGAARVEAWQTAIAEGIIEWLFPRERIKRGLYLARRNTTPGRDPQTPWDDLLQYWWTEAIKPGRPVLGPDGFGVDPRYVASAIRKTEGNEKLTGARVNRRTGVIKLAPTLEVLGITPDALEADSSRTAMDSESGAAVAAYFTKELKRIKSLKDGAERRAGKRQLWEIFGLLKQPTYEELESENPRVSIGDIRGAERRLRNCWREALKKFA
ncbi:MAG: hypothetical protein O7H41_20315 [Planctomycetota bacterium]|nr:hypothetical protein [Planctomycetota bacterium]